ncbi:MAG: helix-turn-helix domain-containing protein [Candidatus Micrarchaeaceae archaeon]
MLACAVCAKGKSTTGRIVGEQSNAEQRSNTTAYGLGASQGEIAEELIDNYGDEIRKARESLGVPIKVLAEKISEKSSTLLRIEQQKALPSDKLVKKLEKELGIKLLKPSQAVKAPTQQKPEQISLWDAAKKKEKKA